jgi:hypothetical protein
MKIEIETENQVVSIETTYRKTCKVFLKYQDEKVFASVPLESLIGAYVAYVMPRTYGAIADKKNPPTEIYPDWTMNGKDVIPVFDSGTRAGQPSKLDYERADGWWALEGDEMNEKLEKVKKWAEHDFTFESLNDEESLGDPHEILAQLARRVRLAVDADAAKRAKEAFA